MRHRSTPTTHLLRAAPRPAGLMILIGCILLQLVALGRAAPARAEGFVEPAFEAQWRATDADVKAGRVSRTYFWGPEPVAHTGEVYVEAGTNGVRRVQYFDKARMELTRRAGQDAGQVTNGLLTVKLVSGRLQIGDTRFLEREPSQVPVAGDRLDNAQTPTYASFREGKLAFGVPGAVTVADRTGQIVRETVDRGGQVSTVSQPPAQVAYARHFPQTGHNVADVFLRFFQAAPLGEARWLSVMGYPIAEPYWAKQQVTVGGRPRDVLIQLFERRAVTYTPANPAGFQVEMGNIGQHYYVWRYNTDPADQVPGNFRLIHAQNRSLYSASIRNPRDRIKLADAPAEITGVWATGENRAVVGTKNGPYLADLRAPRAMQALSVPAELGAAVVEEVSTSADGRRLAVGLRAPGVGQSSVVQIYDLAGEGANRLAVRSSFTARTRSSLGFRLSRSGRYLAAPVEQRVDVVDLENRTTRTVGIADSAKVTRVDWIGASDQFLASAGAFETWDPAAGVYRSTPGSLARVDADTGTVTTILDGPNVRAGAVSPDGRLLAVEFFEGHFTPDSPGNAIVNTVSFRTLANPGVEIAPLFRHQTSARYPFELRLGEWSSDGTTLLVHTSSGGTGGQADRGAMLLSTVTGQPIESRAVSYANLSRVNHSLAGPFYLLEARHLYKGPGAPSEQSIVVRNVDGSEETTVFEAKVAPNVENNDLPITSAQVVQVVTP